jgi:hypothetical protein
MHKSSSLTFFYKYLFTPIWAGFMLFGIASIGSHVDQFFRDWNLFAYLIVFYGLIWLIPMMIRLRKVEVNEANIIIKSPMGDELINFPDVVYVSQYALVNPVLISLKYKRARTGDTRKILIMPSTTSQAFNFDAMAEHEMTKFIRERVVKANANYRISDEPSRWLTFVLTMVGGSIIMIIGVSYFFTFY